MTVLDPLFFDFIVHVGIDETDITTLRCVSEDLEEIFTKQENTIHEILTKIEFDADYDAEDAVADLKEFEEEMKDDHMSFIDENLDDLKEFRFKIEEAIDNKPFEETIENKSSENKPSDNKPVLV